MPALVYAIAALLTVVAAGGGAWMLWPQQQEQPQPTPPPAAPPGDFDLTPPPAPKKEAKPAPPPKPAPLPARLDVRPAAIDFTIVVDREGHVQDGRPSAAVKLTNVGGRKMKIEELLTAGGYGAFGTDTACSGKMLAPAASCTATVTFRPLQPGAFEGSLVIDHSAGDNLRVRLTGLAQLAATPAPSDEAARLARLRNERAAKVAAATPVSHASQDVLLRREPAPKPPAPPLGAPHQDGYGSLVASVTATLPVDRGRILTRDQVIPAVLKSSVSSRIPGPVLATVERDVWSSDTGRLVLVPKGTSVIGHQVAATKRGDARLAVVWTELIRPDGSRIVVNGDSADAMGRVGLVGEVDDRFWERYGGALLISLLGTGQDVLLLELAKGQSTTTSNNSTVVVAGQQSTSNFGAIARSMVNETLNLPPVITVSQGTRFSIFLSADIVFRPPAAPGQEAVVAAADSTTPAAGKAASGATAGAAGGAQQVVPSPKPVTLGNAGKANAGATVPGNGTGRQQ